MADFAAVLRKAVEALKENTPETREKIYQKARATIEAKLAAASPAPQVVERQRELLETAISTVEAEHAPPPPPPSQTEDELESLLAELKGTGVQSAPAVREDEHGHGGNGAAQPPPREAYATPEAPSVQAQEPAWNEDIPAAGPDGDFYHSEDRHAGWEDDRLQDVDWSTARQAPVEGPEALTAPAAAPYQTERPRRSRGRSRGLVFLLLFLVVLGGAAYAGWTYRDGAARLAGYGSFDDLLARVQPAPAGEPEGEGQDVAAEANQSGGAEQPEPTQEAALQRPQKFTQRLMPDGREVDEGPAGGALTLGEGTSVAQSTQSSSPPLQGGQEAGDPGGANAPGSDQALPVGQKAIFYEERTSVSEGYAENGSVVWSVTEETPGNGLPSEPVIHAEATIPQKGLMLKMSIRRNADQSLPASHIVELIFLTPEDFAGGGINNVARIAMKRSEQDTGSPLLGIPAKIDDGFFLVALSDSRADQQANSMLMRRQSWIDIPLVYTSGRRALITLEKGVPGERIFNEALAAWSRGTSG
jgi:hypothetical protein